MHLTASLRAGTILLGRVPAAQEPSDPVPVPILVWVSAPTENPARIAATVAGWQPGDIIEWQLSASLDFDEIYDADIGAAIEPFEVRTEPLQAGTYYARARLIRGAQTGSWSAEITLTIQSTVFEDNFDYPDGTLLEDTGKWDHVAGQIRIISNRPATPTSTLMSLYHPKDLDLSGADSYYTQARRAGGGSSLNLWLAVRAASEAALIAVRYRDNFWHLMQRSGTAETSLAQAAGPNTGSEVMRLVDDTIADTISLYLDGQLVIGPIDAEGFNAGVKQPGLSVRVSGGYTVDDYEAGNL